MRIRSRESVVFCVLFLASAVQAADLLTTNTTATPEAGVAQPAVIGPEKPVVVVNTPDDPVPVRGEIEVVNVPDVNVVNPVSVVSSAPEPIYELLNMSIQDGQQGTGFAELYTVPMGKQLVLTQASGAIGEPTAVSFRVDIKSPGSFLMVNDIAPTRGGPIVFGGPDAWMMNATMNLYVREGQTVTCSIVRHGSAGSAFGRCSIAGYLVDVPDQR